MENRGNYAFFEINRPHRVPFGYSAYVNPMRHSLPRIALTHCAASRYSVLFYNKYGVVDIDDLIVNTLGSLTGIVVYVILQQISFKNQKFEIHELIDICATMLPPMFVAFIAEMFLGDGSLKLLPVHCVVLLCYGIFVYVFLIRDFTRKAKIYYLACYVGAFYLSRVLL